MTPVTRATSMPHLPLPPAPEPAAARQGSLVGHDALSRRESGSRSHSTLEMSALATRAELPLLEAMVRSTRGDEGPLLTQEERVAAQLSGTISSLPSPSASSRFSLSIQAPRSNEAVIDIGRLTGTGEAGAPVQTPLDRITTALRDIEFRTPSQAQRSLENEYIAWAAGVLQARENTFGNGRYSIDSSRSVSFGEAALPALYDGVRQFLSSASRSPVAGALTTALAPRYSGADATGNRVNQGELTNNYDPAVIGGAIGGVTALAMDSTLLSAMDRRARLANLPQYAPVDLKSLVPDPAPVQLRLVEGKKEYWRPLTGKDELTAAPDRPTMAALLEEAQQKRQRLATVQGMLQAQGWGLLAQPLVTGAVNLARRYVMPTKWLLQPAPVLVGSMLASGAAGGATKLGLGLLKAPAYADVDNLMGGKQRVNLFRTQLPQPDVRAATWSDAPNLRRHAGEVLQETGSLLKHYLAGPWRGAGGPVPSGSAVLTRVGDIAHAVVSNTFANVFSIATGPLLGQMLRDGAAAARTGEGQQSPAYLLQQFAQSSTNDFVWQATRSAFKSSAFNLAGSLDRWRENREIKLLQTARRAQGELPDLARELASSPASRGDAALRHTLQTLQALRPDAKVQTAALREALNDLKRYTQERGGDASASSGPLMQRIETVLQSMEQRDAMARWRAPAGQH